MTAKKDLHIVAAIDVGANNLKMTIAEITDQDKYHILEDLTKPTNIGRDTFTTGRISVQTIQETCSDLKGFSMLMKDYRIKSYRAISTSGLREAENSEYIVEQIRMSTGIHVNIINNAEENLLAFKALGKQYVKAEPLSSGSYLMVNVASGGMEVSLYNKGTLEFTEHIKLGSLRLSEILSDLETMTLDFPKVMEEFIDSKIYLLKFKIQKLGVETFVGLGGELETISRLCKGKSDKNGILINGNSLYKLYSKMLTMSTDQIINNYGISKKEAEILLPSVILFQCFLNLTRAEGIYAPMTTLRHGLLYEIAEEIYFKPEIKEDFSETLDYARYVAEKYCVDQNHSAFVEKTALSIFDQTMRLHKLDNRERLYLRVAAILHDAGKFVRFSDPDIQTFHIIKKQNITGFSDRELLLTANAARYHGQDLPSREDKYYGALNEKEKILVSKLAAILKLGDSLDLSHRQKITTMDICQSSDKLYFKIVSSLDTLLEEWDFSRKASFFQEVMGVAPEIKK